MKSLITAAILGLAATGGAWAAEQVAKIEVTGLTCPSCPYIASKAVKSVESVEIVEGKYDEAAQLIVFDVKFDDAVTTAEEIAAAPFEFGYPGTVLSVGVSGS